MHLLRLVRRKNEVVYADMNGALQDNFTYGNTLRCLVGNFSSVVSGYRRLPLPQSSNVGKFIAAGAPERTTQGLWEMSSSLETALRVKADQHVVYIDASVETRQLGFLLLCVDGDDLDCNDRETVDGIKEWLGWAQ